MQPKLHTYLQSKDISLITILYYLNFDVIIYYVKTTKKLICNRQTKENFYV